MRKKMIVAGFILALAMHLPAGAADPQSKIGPEHTMVWFDGTGAYHYDDPLPYLNDVISGKIKDPDISRVILSVCKERTTVNREDIPAIADALDPLTDTAAFYPDDTDRLATHAKKIQEHFKTVSGAPSNLSIKSFGFMNHGDSSMLSGAPPTDMLLAVPADPDVLRIATNQVKDNVLQLERILVEAAESAKWRDYSWRGTVGMGGVSLLFNLKPGPWVVYLNQKDVITQCYRVILPAGGKKEVVADKMCVPPRKWFVLENPQENKGS